MLLGVWGRCSPTASAVWQIGPHMKALSPKSDFSPFLPHSATLFYLYNNYQVLFWGFGRFSPTAFSRLWQMGPHMKALSPISDFSPFMAHSVTLSYLYNNYQVCRHSGKTFPYLYPVNSSKQSAWMNAIYCILINPSMNNYFQKFTFPKNNSCSSELILHKIKRMIVLCSIDTNVCR